MGSLHEDLSPRQLSDELIKLSAVWRNRYRILAATLGAAVAVAGIVTHVTPIYEATGEVMVAGGESRVIDIANVSPDVAPNEPVVQSEVAVFNSMSLLVPVVKELGLEGYPEFNPSLRDPGVFSYTRSFIEKLLSSSTVEESKTVDDVEIAASELAAHVSVRPLGVSYVIEVTTSSESPTRAAQITNALIRYYLQNQVDKKLEASKRAANWLGERVDQLREDVIAAERRIEASKAKAAAEGYSSETAVELRELQREAEALRAVYQQFLVRLKETRERGTFQEPDAKIVSHAQIPNSPIWPQKTLLVFLGGFAGGFMAIVATLIADGHRCTLNSEEDVWRHCALPLLGNIPKVPERTFPVEILNWMSERPFSALAEGVRWLSLRLWLQNDARRSSQIIVVTSALPGEGKSTLSLLLAHNSMANGSQTLLFDADLRRKSISRAFSGTDSGSNFVEERGFTIYRCDSSIGGEHGVLQGAILRDVISAAQDKYETIIIDAPPCLSVSDIAPLCRNADKTIMVCKWETTPYGAVQQAVRQLRDLSIDVDGLVLNMVDLERQAETAFAGGAYALRKNMAYYSDEAIHQSKN